MEAQNEVKEVVLRCKTSTDANKLAGSIYSTYQSSPESRVVIRVIGAGSLNQAIKAAIISNKYFSKKGIVVAVQPSFQDADDNVTAIELQVIFRKM